MLKTLAVVAITLAVVYAGGEGGGGSSSRRVESLARSTNARYSAPIQYPCRFDCMQIVNKNSGLPLFASCQNSVIKYNGDFFGQQAQPGFAINYQCLTPTTYAQYFTSRNKLATVIDICQNTAHKCRKLLNQQYVTAPGNSNSFPGLPALDTLALRTTSLYYQWYSQFESIRTINNVVRCPASYKAASAGRNGRNRCNCDLVNFPELFSASSPKMPTSVSDSYRNKNQIPNPVNPASSYVDGFFGNYTDINPFPSVDGDRATLLLQARLVLPTISRPVHLGCIDDDVDITEECD